MKKRFRIWRFILPVLLTISVGSYAQQSPADDSSSAPGAGPQPSYQCKQIIYDTDQHVLTLLDDVSFKTPAFNLRKAGKVVYNLKEGKLTIYDCEDFTFDGKIQIKANAPRTNVVQYTLRDDTVYVR